MARETFGSLRTTSQDYVSDATAGTLTFLDKEINKAIRLIRTNLKAYITHEPPTTINTLNGVQFYDFPVDIFKIEAATLTIGGVAYPLQVVNSYTMWNKINQITFSGSTIPQFIFPRMLDFGIYPTPSGIFPIALTFHPREIDMSVADYTTGTADVTKDSATVTGSGAAVWTDRMVGRWFKIDTDGEWYRIKARAGNTFTLHKKYEGVTDLLLAYTLGESPNIPDELHELIPHKAASSFYSGPRKDYAAAQSELNYFWTGDFNNSDRSLKNKHGGLLGAIVRYSKGDESAMVYRESHTGVNRFDERWSTTLSGA